GRDAAEAGSRDGADRSARPLAACSGTARGAPRPARQCRSGSALRAQRGARFGLARRAAPAAHEPRSPPDAARTASPRGDRGLLAGDETGRVAADRLKASAAATPPRRLCLPRQCAARGGLARLAAQRALRCRAPAAGRRTRLALSTARLVVALGGSPRSRLALPRRLQR